MPNINRGVRPGIADIQCSRLQFQPGDRIIVRSHSRLDQDQKNRLRKSIIKFAGCEVEVLFVCLLDFDIDVTRNGRPIA